jgi:eukaryotic-like serine/threonine-protein kinase
MPADREDPPSAGAPIRGNEGIGMSPTPDSSSVPCAECGRWLEANTPEGLCPHCLLELALSAVQNSGFQRGSPLALGDFADYELLSEIGHGGMGVVYKARQKSLDRIVALKMLLGGLFAEPQARARFRTEAELTAQLQHPNIVAIHEVGEHDHLPFFTMDYVEGRSLAEVARDKPLTPAAAAGYLATIARAIAYAHEHGVLHRDLKPSNILMDGADQPRITDFGLAKRLTGSTSNLTMSGEALGSPNFMPPEQAAGKHKLIGPASDVYGLGAVLYYLLTSRPPFVADNLTAAVRQVQDQEPVSPRMLNPGVPKDLETICLQCLQKEPARRYPTAAELADELDRFRRGEPIRARPVGPVGRLGRWCRRRPALAAMAAAVIALAAISTTVAIGMAIEREGRERERYRANIQLAAARIEEGSIDVALETLLACPERFRHWEWGYLVAQCHREVMTLETARDVVRNETLEYANVGGGWRCAFSQDDQRIGAFHARGLAQVWDLSSGNQVWSLHEESDPEVGIAWLPDLSGVVLAQSNRVVVVHAGDSHEPLELLGHQQVIRRLALSADGRWVAALAADQLIRVWDITNGREISVFSPIPGLENLLFTGDGRRVVVASHDEVATYDTQTGTELLRIGSAADGNLAVLPDPEGERFITVNFPVGATTMRLQHWTTNGLVSDLGMVRSWGPLEAVFSPDRTLFCVSGHGSTAAVRDARTGSSLFAIPTRVTRAAFSPDGRRLATCGGTSIIQVWDPEEGRELLQLKGHTEAVQDVAFSRDGRLLASVSAYGTVKIWSALPGREIY